MTTEEAVALLLSQMRKLRDGQEAMRSAQEETSQKLARSSGRRDPYTFKRKANKNQFCFNQDVEVAFAEVSARLKKVNPDDLGERGKLGLQKAMSAAEEGTSLLARRQKLLKLADRSEWGWAVMEETSRMTWRMTLEIEKGWSVRSWLQEGWLLGSERPKDFEEAAVTEEVTVSVMFCCEKGILTTCTNMCTGANKGASGEFISCQGVGNSCEIVNREGMMHGAHGEFHLPRISGNTS